MKLLDVNILVQAHREDALQHAQVRDWLESALQQPSGVAVTHLVLSGFLRVVTHPRIFIHPTPLEDAVGFVEDFTRRRRVSVIAPGPRHWKIFLELCQAADARGNLIPDAYHAAVALEFGLEWITLDRGFARYPGLRWRAIG